MVDVGIVIIAHLRHKADNDVRDGAISWSEFRRAMDWKFANWTGHRLSDGEAGNKMLHNHMHWASNRVRHEILHAVKEDA